MGGDPDSSVEASAPSGLASVAITSARHERRAWAVAGLATAAAAVELVGGTLTGSAALLAEGLHMSAHVTAFLLAALAYVAARRLEAAHRPRAARMAPNLAALLNGLLLLGLGVGLAVESIEALRHPRPIAYGSALAVAVFGLAVNVASAALLRHDHAHEPGHRRDMNFRVIHLHVLGDGAVAALAIVGLLFGRALGWRWTDSVAGVLGAALLVVLGLRVTVHNLEQFVSGQTRTAANRSPALVPSPTPR